jgi:hypothetical protein
MQNAYGQWMLHFKGQAVKTLGRHGCSNFGNETKKQKVVQLAKKLFRRVGPDSAPRGKIFLWLVLPAGKKIALTLLDRSAL